LNLPQVAPPIVQRLDSSNGAKPATSGIHLKRPTEVA
jgi:hypothetical protein